MDVVMAALEKNHPGLETKLVRSVVKTTMKQYKSSMYMLVEGAILAVLVIWWFLRDWRATVLGGYSAIRPTGSSAHT
jgi:multidrug efflux pump subunit AcrB